MALGKKKLVAAKSSPKSNQHVVGDEGLRSRKKSVLISGNRIQDSEKICKSTLVIYNPKLETLPQDILLRIIYKVDHEDLKKLFNVSKTIREATIIAKESYFEYSTPKKTQFFRGELDLGDEMEAPLLKKSRLSKTISDKKISEISVALFK